MKQKFKEAVNEYILAFCLKQDIDWDYWIGNDVGGVACFGDLYLNFDDIRFDIDSNQPAGLITDHYWESVYNDPKVINYRSYAMGLRYDQV